MSRLLALCRVLAVVSSALPVFSQVDTGTIAGTVRDSSGAILLRVKVSIVSDITGQKFEIETNSEGIYVSPPLRAGEYVITAAADGFERAARRAQLDVSQRAVIDFDLAVGSVTQEVTVVAVSPILQTESSTLSNVRTEKAIKDLPLNGRNFAQLLQLSAGVMPAQTQTTGSPTTMKRGVTGNSVNGMRFEENNYLVDGISNTENHNGLGILIFPSVDAIAEFRVEASVSDAQFGRGGGGTVNLVYKSGSQDFHGNLFEFFRNAELDAKNYFDRASDPIPPFKQNQFGATLGGPLFPWAAEKNTLFFVSYEGMRVRQAQTLISTVPTAGMRDGDFSGAPRIFDPLTQRQTAPGQFARDPFPGNRIPQNRISGTGRNLLNLYALPNLGSGIANNFLFNPVRSITGNKFDIKVDQTFSERDVAFVRYSYSNDDLDEPSFLPAPAVGNGPGVPGPASQPVTQVVASETHIFSPALSNEARAGWTRLDLRAFNINYGKYVSSDIGVPGGNVPGDVLTSGLSIFTIAGLRDLGDNGFSPAIIVSDNIQLNDNVNLVSGKHSLKFGADVQRRRYNAFQSDVLRGSMNFSGTYTQDPASRAGTGLGCRGCTPRPSDQRRYSLLDRYARIPSNGTRLLHPGHVQSHQQIDADSRAAIREFHRLAMERSGRPDASVRAGTAGRRPCRHERHPPQRCTRRPQQLVAAGGFRICITGADCTACRLWTVLLGSAVGHDAQPCSEPSGICRVLL